MAAMAVKGESLHHATQSLILQSPRKYYRVHMSAEHWQLRSFISAPKLNTIYYLNGPDILRINTIARERETVTTLPFSPKCLIAAGGYVCCGGDKGDFAAVRIDGREGELSTYATGVDGEPDARLPLNLDPVRRLAGQSETPGLRRRELPPLAMVAKVGSEIVNCVTMWFPKADISDQTYSKPVAVLSNNDRTVSVVSLPEAEVLDKLELEDCVNRAVMSPDGNLLIAIGDDPYMHIFERIHSGPKIARRATWVKAQRVKVHDQPPGDPNDCRGSFAIVFSPSGRYLAIGTQYGQISVYETSLLTRPEEDPLFVTFTTSRPNSKDGAVRAMEFSPEPYDLLAWTEHSSRVTIADLRRHFMSRQIIYNDPRADGMERVMVNERIDDSLIDPRLRNPQSDSEGLVNDSSSLERQFTSLASLARGVLARQPSPLTREETLVLDALHVDRLQRDRESLVRQAQSNAAQHTPLSWTDLAEDIRSNWRERSVAQNWRDEVGARRMPATLPTTLRDFVGTRPNDSLRAYIDERNRDRERRDLQPRRRGSVILAATANALERHTQEPVHETPRSELSSGRDRPSSAIRLPAEILSARDRLLAGPPRLPAIGSDTLNNPWAEIEALYNISVDPPVDHATRLRVEVEAENRRDYTRRLEERRGGLDERGQLRLGIEREEPGALSNRTTGCCWSQDGKILYVGAEIGIYEYHVNVTSRKIFPSINVR